MRNKFLIVSSILTLLLTGCNDEKIDTKAQNEFLSEQIEEKVRSEAGYLANLEASFGLDFINSRKNMIFGDDFYVRMDDLKAYYGIPLEKLKIEVKDQGTKKTLFVYIPNPILITVDKKTLDIQTRNQKYTPVDKNGKVINTDLELTKYMYCILDNYENKMLDMSRTISKEYFESLAYRFNMKPDINFEDKPNIKKISTCYQDDNDKKK